MFFGIIFLFGYMYGALELRLSNDLLICLTNENETILDLSFH